ELEHQLISMYAEGWKKRALTRHFGISKNTVKRILNRNEAQRDRGDDALSEINPARRKSMYSCDTVKLTHCDNAKLPPPIL
ncbi:MAG: helix-turn-helix domain-containing protein, partial [Planctomycetaceae bacterium]|nr:helix-turn-helix domain-containing protein [Planctomycetaceae bacterium]